MLPDAFIDWWFTPWRYATGIPARVDAPLDLLAQRDQYGWWCAEAGVRADIPDEFDPAWQVAAAWSGPALRKGAELFAGLIAARVHDQAVLDRLDIADRRWCMSIAITQPLKPGCEVTVHPTDPVEVRGLVDLAGRLESGFPGVWTRLRLLLPEPLTHRVETLLASTPAAANPSAGATARAQRCWHMCHVRAATLTAH
jgi:hypothetical protein